MDHRPLPAWCVPHSVTVKPYAGEGGAGPTYGASRSVAAFAEDEQAVVIGDDGAEVVSKSRVHVDFDELIPAGSLVTVWPGTPGVREAKVITMSRHHHPSLPSYQTLHLT